ncbi:MAG: NAD-dependent succinate-semialdehyde dehydrogenase [Candidatus Nitrosocaldus sp.]|nr:NAD-dependent succinate-semialdehyde dehydrogenase [Candidatus Nitrosocaldus sp.]MDW8274950.1 NAD-dependent succinate-semialdehyde dehydrogenase [Candidatus Nitrosocaldus sp.]
MMSSDRIVTINPASEEVVGEHVVMSRDQVIARVKSAKEAFQHWRRDTHRRASVLYEVASILRKERDNLARTATMEMGKTIREARAEVEKCAWTIEYFADNGEHFIDDEVTVTDARKTFIAFEPLGTIGSIMPWNFPYWQGIRFAAPALMAGNTIVMKPSSTTLQCGKELERIFSSVDNLGIFSVVIGDARVGEMLIDSPVDAVTFTGSVEVGARVASRAAMHVKKCVLELGGSDPFIVLDDADIDKASSAAVKGRFINNGQSCIASKRFIVMRSVAKEFIESFARKAERMRVGDPMHDDTDLGPVVNRHALEYIDGIVRETVMEGGEVLVGGERVGSKGYYYAPTLITKVKEGMRIVREEVFGPVAPIMIVDDEREAIRLANDSEFGLGASVWTTDLDRAERLARSIEAGLVTINNVVISDPRVPFGGVKKSGFGRELSRYGMLEFMNIKTVRFYDQLIHYHHVE